MFNPQPAIPTDGLTTPPDEFVTAVAQEVGVVIIVGARTVVTRIVRAKV